MWYYDDSESGTNWSQLEERIGNGMNCTEIIFAIINLLVVIASPIIAVWVGQKLQDREQKRKDKMAIFQCLMSRRITGWAGIDAVNALNSIDIVFADSAEVCNQWGVLHSKYRNNILPQEQNREQCKLLELMANDLGYKDKITWETIQNPYYPEGLDKQIAINTQIRDGQVEWAKAAGKLVEMMDANAVAKQQKQSEESTHANP